MRRLIGCSVLYWILALPIAFTMGVAVHCATNDLVCEGSERSNTVWGALAVFALLYGSVIVVQILSRRE